MEVGLAGLAWWPTYGENISPIESSTIEFAVQSRLDECKCTSAQASKLCGVLGFTLTSLYSKVGRRVQHALPMRQYWDTETVVTNGENITYCGANSYFTY